MILITYWFGWCGYFMDFRLLPSWLRWFPRGNSLMYSQQLMMHVLVTDDQIFSCRGFEVIDNARHSICVSPDDWISGAEAKAAQGIDNSQTLCLGVMLVSLLVFRVLSYVLLRIHLRDV